MTTALSRGAEEISPEEVARMTASWPDLLHTPIPSQEEADVIAGKCRNLNIPAGKTWIAGQVATLLSQYYVSSIPDAIMRETAEIWGAELDGYPAWAIQKSARWWLGKDNPKRGRKPMPGDISARCKVEMGVVKVAEFALRKFHSGTPLADRTSHA